MSSSQAHAALLAGRPTLPPARPAAIDPIDHPPDGGLGAEVRPLQVAVQHPAVVPLVHVQEPLGAPDAGVVHRHVHAAERLRRVDGRLGVVELRDVALDELGAGVRVLGDGLVSGSAVLIRLLTDVGDDDVGALLGVRHRDGAPDARAPADDDRYTVGG